MRKNNWFVAAFISGLVCQQYLLCCEAILMPSIMKNFVRRPGGHQNMHMRIRGQGQFRMNPQARMQMRSQMASGINQRMQPQMLRLQTGMSQMTAGMNRQMQGQMSQLQSGMSQMTAGINRQMQSGMNSLQSNMDQLSQQTASLGGGFQENMKQCPLSTRAMNNIYANSIQSAPTVARFGERTSRLSPELDQMAFLHELGNMQFKFEEATRVLSKQTSLQNVTGDVCLRYNNFSDLKRTCQQRFQPTNCDVQWFVKVATGRCNKQDTPLQGASNTCLARLLPPLFADGISTPRRATSGKPLPCARKLALALNAIEGNVEDNKNDLNMLWIYFAQASIAHDISLIGSPFIPDGTLVNCCDPKRKRNPLCNYNMMLDDDDPFYRRFGKKCNSFIRSLPCAKCEFGPRTPVNMDTSLIDGSEIYGSTVRIFSSLLAPGGKLQNNDRLQIPSTFSENVFDACNSLQQNDQDICFRSGDVRVNQHTLLTVMTNLFIRNHNNLVDLLRELNPRWSGERLFREARKINNAQKQAIIFGEWLPEVLSPQFMDLYKLNIKKEFPTSFVPSIDPTVSVEFAHAAFRSLHSMIQPVSQIRFNNGTSGIFRLAENYRNPKPLHQNQSDSLVRGLLLSPAYEYGAHQTQDMAGSFFTVSPNEVGNDIFAMDIQRGRDVGLRPYIDYLKLCTGNEIARFDDLSDVMSQDAIELLKRLYEDIRDVDLYVGGILEKAQPVMGVTFNCIFAKQFRGFKFGDKHYFEHSALSLGLKRSIEDEGFTPPQINELRKTTLAGVLCKNFLDPRISEMAPKAFKMAESDTNKPKLCRDIEQPDFKIFKERKNVNIITNKIFK